MPDGGEGGLLYFDSRRLIAEIADLTFTENALSPGDGAG